MTKKVNAAEFKAIQASIAGKAANKGKSKYRNKKVELDGFVFDSQWEANCWTELRLRQEAGEIRALERQKRVKCIVNGKLICSMIADFVYQERRNGIWRPVIEDAKSPATRRLPAYRIKKKLVEACTGIEVRELVKGKC